MERRKPGGVPQGLQKETKRGQQGKKDSESERNNSLTSSTARRRHNAKKSQEKVHGSRQLKDPTEIEEKKGTSTEAPNY